VLQQGQCMLREGKNLSPVEAAGKNGKLNSYELT
jgi:hypothetical protein